jgi:hypothetical protein
MITVFIGFTCYARFLILHVPDIFRLILGIVIIAQTALFNMAEQCNSLYTLPLEKGKSRYYY